MKLEKEPKNRALEAMKAASRIAEENGISDMTLEEINAKIAKVREKIYIILAESEELWYDF